MLPQQYCLRWRYHHSNLQTMFSQLLDRGCFCDVTLACEGQLIRAHRVVLCACSTFFDTVLSNYASERDPIIIMKDVTFAEVKCLIEFMYKGEINVEHAQLASLLKTADDLKIKGLAEVSWRDEEDMPPPPTPAAEFHSPTRPLELCSQDVERDVSPIRENVREHRSESPINCKIRPQIHNATPVTTSAQNVSITASPEHLGPKRKRGRPPLDDAYDVFNIRKIAQYMDHQAYLESRQYADEQQQSKHPIAASNTITTSANAYQQHIQQQHNHHNQRQQRLHSAELENDNEQTDPEWITSNLEVNVAECEQPINGNKTEMSDIKDLKEHVEDVRKKEVITEKHEKKHRSKSPEQKERTTKERKLRKISKEERERRISDDSMPKRLVVEKELPLRDNEEASTVPQPVEEIENVQHVLEHQSPASTAASTNSSTSNTTHLTHKHGLATVAGAPPPPPPPPLHHFGKYAPEGYFLNEHGILMTHDFVHATTVSIPTSSASGAGGSGSSSVATSGNGTNGNDDYMDIKMEDYDAADLRLTSEEMSQWQDVIKMDDYLAKGRRPQFWEEPFTRRVLDAIKNKRLEMKKAARILGVSYGTLYGRYREVYGCLKHPYSNSTFRAATSTPIGLQPRFDVTWPTSKRDSGVLLPGQLEIGKIRPKDLSELWARPQI
ncbi:protein tramtrack, beta isoform-like [Teleopsis dalmanni]|uniref:protein tramtrack, beta isoform-like n=1 Tax=Teleopsis dalmanni TaxID=139649 RepID=UPI000D329D33|nr:protein tramtrack, beta isoform-like [Teleopsis dalmanni]